MASDVQLLHILAASTPQAFVCVNEDLEVLVCNSAARQWLGEAQGSAHLPRIAPFHPIALGIKRLKDRKAVAEGELHQIGSIVELSTQEGDRSRCETTVIEAILSVGLCYNVLIRNLTPPREEAVTKSNQLSESICTLANGVAHDFNNVLTAVVSHLDLALLNHSIPNPVMADLSQARSAAMRGVELVRRLQSYSQSNGIRPVPTDPSRLISTLIPVLKGALPENIHLLVEPKPALDWEVLADAHQLSHVLLNLGLNARDAMLSGGTLTVAVECVHCERVASDPLARVGDFVRIMLRDTGTGMPESVLRRVFQPYFTTKAFGKGIGLGLVISQNVVTEHKGWMEVESQIGVGSTFYVYLPRHQEPLQPTPRDNGALQPLPEHFRHFEGTETVLIVDDEEMIRLVMRSILAYRGYKVMEAPDGESALDFARTFSGKIDIILLDVHMPRLNGWTALKKLQELLPSVLVIMLSGDGREFKTDTAASSKAAGFLEKPFDNAEFLQTIRAALDKRNKPAP